MKKKLLNYKLLFLFNFYYLLIGTCVILITSCGESDKEQQERFMSELDCPIILIGKTDNAIAYPSIVVRDGKGRVRIFTNTHGSIEGNGLSAAITYSRQVGDTLKPCICDTIRINSTPKINKNHGKETHQEKRSSQTE